MSDVQTYRIPAVNFPYLQEEIEKLNKRAARLKMEPVVLEILETVTEKKRNDVIGFDYQETYHICVVKGESPKLSGWTLVAIIEPTGTENFIREIPGQKCPAEYRTTDIHCDHCDAKRKRTAIFVLKNENGIHKQVGRQCLADFLGHEHPESLLSKAEFLFSFDKLVSDSREEGWGRASGQIIVPTSEFVTAASVVIRKMGWLPRSKASDFQKPTADIVWEICTNSADRKVRELIHDKDLHATQDDIDMAEAAIKWAAQIDPNTAPNTYLYDLGVCCRQAYVDSKRRGFAASVIQAHQRVVNEERERKLNPTNSIFLGEIGKRQNFGMVEVISTTSYTSGIYQKTLVKLRDESGNILIWRASGQPQWAQPGKKCSIRATVKKHLESGGLMETEVQRVDPIELDKMVTVS